MSNPVVHWQILCRRPEALQTFYTALFEWTVSDANALGYRRVDAGGDGGIGGGLWPIGSEGQPMVQLFVRVDDVAAHVARAVALGGTVVIPPTELPEGDEMAVVVDPEGIPFAVFRGAGASPR